MRPIMNLPTILKNARLKNGYTQKEIAETLDVSLRHYQRLETGERSPNADHLIKLIILLEIDRNDFIG